MRNMQINRAQQPLADELESTMRTPTLDGYRFKVSPDGIASAWVHPLDPADPTHAGWTDCTDMSNDEFHAFIVERQGTRPQIVGVAVGS